MSEPVETMRIDRLLVYLRFARTRSAARAMIECQSLRRNRDRVLRVSEAVAVGDVLTFARGDEVCIVEVLAIPPRRCSPAAAKAHYRQLARG